MTNFDLSNTRVPLGGHSAESTFPGEEKPFLDEFLLRSFLRCRMRFSYGPCRPSRARTRKKIVILPQKPLSGTSVNGVKIVEVGRDDGPKLAF